MTARSCRQRGFSLLEVLVAFSIMALSLGALYQAAGGSVRGALEAERQSRALFLAQSLLTLHPSVTEAGVRESGVFEDLRWSVHSEPYPLAGDPPPTTVLQRVVVLVQWVDRGRHRDLVLTTLVPQRQGGQ